MLSRTRSGTCSLTYPASYILLLSDNMCKRHTTTFNYISVKKLSSSATPDIVKYCNIGSCQFSSVIYKYFSFIDYTTTKHHKINYQKYLILKFFVLKH